MYMIYEKLVQTILWIYQGKIEDGLLVAVLALTQRLKILQGITTMKSRVFSEYMINNCDG